MNKEMIAIIGLIFCLLIIAIEFIWLYILAERQEDHVKKYDNASRTIDSMIETILFHPTEQTMRSEIESLKNFVGNDSIKIDTVSTRILSILLSNETDDNQKAAVCAINEAIRPIDYYIELLHKGNPYEKAYACRKVAIFYEEKELPYIRKLAFSKNKDLSYNAAMALAYFGDEDALSDFILKCENNYSYSHRIILEIMSNYAGDLSSLARKVLSQCNDYIKVIIIKGLSDHAYTEFESIYLEGINNHNANLKIACIRALGKIGKPEYEHALITAAHDKNWIVRSTAVKELGRLNTENTKQALVAATHDPEWWVRYNAAKTLVSVDTELTYVESVLNGYDKYGADAVKYVLYKKYNIGEKNC